MIKWLRYAFACFLLSVVVVIAYHYQPENSFSARCIKVFDCKRIIVWLDDQWFYNRMKIKLEGVQCPERTSTMGKKARAYVKSVIYGKIIDIEIVKRRFWGWSDAIIYYNGVCLNRDMKKKWKQ